MRQRWLLRLRLTRVSFPTRRALEEWATSALQRTMKAKQFSEEQSIAVMKSAEARAKTKDLCRR